MNYLKNILFIFIFIAIIFCSFILGSIATIKDYQGATEQERYTYAMRSICRHKKGIFINSSKDYFYKFKNKKSKTKNGKFKITINCLEKTK